MIKRPRRRVVRESALRRMRIRRRLMENRRRPLRRRRLVEDVEEEDTEEECYFIEQAVYNDIMAACKKWVNPKYGFDVGYMPGLCKENVKVRGGKFEADILRAADFLEDVGRGEVEDIKEAVKAGIVDTIKPLRAYIMDDGDYEWRVQKFYLNRIADILDEPALRP